MSNHGKNNQWIDPISEVSYDLGHLEPFETGFKIKLSKNAPLTDIQGKVIFSKHCYSRKKTESDDPSHIITTERKRDGTIEDRVFCPNRWDFSIRIPEIIKNLNDKLCLEGNRRHIVFRQEDKTPPSGHDGWYICMNLNYRKERDPQFELRVTSAHWRPNRPDGMRPGGSTRFGVLLSRYLKSRM